LQFPHWDRPKSPRLVKGFQVSSARCFLKKSRDIESIDASRSIAGEGLLALPDNFASMEAPMALIALLQWTPMVVLFLAK
jgi:hypothetical protein